MTPHIGEPADPERQKLEASVRACYESWSTRYYDDYYRGQGAYPPVHVDLVRNLLQDQKVRTLLDAGCGPASMLREFEYLGDCRWGFDLTPQMVAEAQRVLAGQGVASSHVWQGSVLDRAAYRPPSGGPEQGFDAATCFGVLPHIPAADDGVVLSNLAAAVRPGGLVAVEARNQLFALYSLNRYSRDLFRDVLIDAESLRRAAENAADLAVIERTLARLDDQFRTDLPPVRKGSESRPGYDEVLSRTHNPFLLRQRAEQCGLVDTETLFYHFHALPPMFEAEMPSLFKRASLALENPRDWRGHFMASAFVLVGRRSP